MTIFADVTGEFTDSAPGAVTISAGHGTSAAIDIEDQSSLLLDGFTILGGTSVGVQVTGGSDVEVQDCVLTGMSSDAVRFVDSVSGLVFNNLIVRNGGAGISVFGSDSLLLVNNTIYKNSGSGILIGADIGGTGSQDVALRNNIITNNIRGTMPSGVLIDSASASGFDADYNLNTDGYAGGEPGFHDLDQPVIDDPLFIAPTRLDGFRLPRSLSGSGTSPAVDAGDPDTDSDLLDELASRTTSTDGTTDEPPPDMGYHYVAPPPPTVPATRRPAATATSTRRPATPTRTPTP